MLLYCHSSSQTIAASAVMKASWWSILTALLSVSTLGCGNDGMVKVSGTVSQNGIPLTQGKIRFIPDRGRPATASIASDGSYKLARTKDSNGFPPGDYSVTVRVTETDISGGGGYADPNNTVTTKWIVPEQYAEQETTPLRATVPAGGTAEIDFDISTE